MSKMVVIFVAGQAQNLMLPGLMAKCEGEEFFIFSAYPFAGGCKGRVFNIKPSNFWEGLKLLYGILFVSWRLRFARKIDFYAPHVLNFLANKIYFSFRHKIDFYYLFDGILNYREVPANFGDMRKYQNRQAFKSFLIFHVYVRSLGGVVDQELRNVKGMMVPEGVLEDKLSFRLPVWKVEGIKGSYKPKDRILVLPPPLKGKELQVFQEKLERLLLDEHPNNLVLIKPHPSQVGSDLDFMSLIKRGLSVERVSDVRPAETVFIERECCAVVSSTSSALLLLKSLYPEAKAYSIIGDAERSDKELMRVVDVMVGSGVTLI